MAQQGIEGRIRRKAHELGADLVGLVPGTAVCSSASHQLQNLAGSVIDGDDAGQSSIGPAVFADVPGKTIVVLALAHPENRPELDFFSPAGNTPGNSILLRIVRDLMTWLKTDEGLSSRSLHYVVERGGVFLKDAAVLAGLGCIGRNNLLVTPEFGPRVRLRGVLVDADFEPDTPIDFDPCADCPEYCRAACPRGALMEEVQLPCVLDPVHRPARDGHYRRSLCMIQMNQDRAGSGSAALDLETSMESDQLHMLNEYPVVHCRQCELSCPVGSDGIDRW